MPAIPTRRISVTVERPLIDEIIQLAGNDVTLSAVVTDALRVHARRLGMLAYLDELDRENPISPEQREAGERLWQQIASSSVPARQRVRGSAERSN
jgi:hypothetical protein